VDVTDLAPAPSEVLPCRAVLALDETCIREEVLDPGEPADFMDLVEDGQGEDLADSGDGTEPVEGIASALDVLVPEDRALAVEDTKNHGLDVEVHPQVWVCEWV